jgi:hypothetical protein
VFDNERHKVCAYCRGEWSIALAQTQELGHPAPVDIFCKWTALILLKLETPYTNDLSNKGTKLVAYIWSKEATSKLLASSSLLLIILNIHSFSKLFEQCSCSHIILCYYFFISLDIFKSIFAIFLHVKKSLIYSLFFCNCFIAPRISYNVIN